MRTPGATIAVAATLAVAASAAVIDDRAQKGAPAAPRAPLEVLWQQPLPVSANTTMAPGLVAGDAVVVVARPGVGLSAFASKDGNPIWSVAAAPVASPILARETVVVATHGALRALALATGDPAWQAELDADPSALFSAGDRVGAVIADELRVWDAAGVPVWRAKLGARPVTAVAFRNGVLYAGLDEPSIVAIDAASGAERWRMKLPSQADSLAVTDDRLFVGAADEALYAFPISGKAEPAWRYHLLRSIGPPLADGRLVFFALLDNSVRALDRNGGSQRWSRVLPGRPVTGPILIGSSLAVALTSGAVVELAAEDGRMLEPATAREPAASTGAVRLQASAVSRDGTRVYTVTIAKDYSSSLVAWGRAPATKQGAARPAG